MSILSLINSLLHYKMTRIIRKNSTLVVVGTGIKSLSHLTIEARSNIEQADLVLFLVNEPAMQEWIVTANPNAESLDKLYFSEELRSDSYASITSYILEKLKDSIHICVVLYGHPAVFAKPALDAVIQAKKAGYDAKILPAISAEDCLFSDLLIDPGSCGCMSLEATDMLVHKKVLDVTSHLVIWQISVIGAMGHADQHDNRIGMAMLTEYLTKYYNPEHFVYVYVAAQYPAMEPKIDKIKLLDLSSVQVSRLATLYVPPLKKADCDIEAMKSLGIKEG